MPIYVNVDGAQKVLSDVYANIDGAQRRVTTMYANIDGSQKNLMGYKWAKYKPVYEKVTTKNDSVHLYDSINGWLYNFAYKPGSELSFDATTGYFSGADKERITESFSGIETPSTRDYLCLGYQDNTDGRIWNGFASPPFYGIMGYYIPKGATIAVDSDEKGATFSYTNNITIYSSEPSTTQHGDFIEYVTSNDETAYPDNGLQDGYWYIRQ